MLVQFPCPSCMQQPPSCMQIWQPDTTEALHNFQLRMQWHASYPHHGNMRCCSQVLDEVCDISVVKFFRHSSKLLTNGAKELVN